MHTEEGIDAHLSPCTINSKGTVRFFPVASSTKPVACAPGNGSLSMKHGRSRPWTRAARLPCDGQGQCGNEDSESPPRLVEPHTAALLPLVIGQVHLLAGVWSSKPAPTHSNNTYWVLHNRRHTSWPPNCNNTVL